MAAKTLVKKDRNRSVSAAGGPKMDCDGAVYAKSEGKI